MILWYLGKSIYAKSVISKLQNVASKQKKILEN